MNLKLKFPAALVCLLFTIAILTNTSFNSDSTTLYANTGQADPACPPNNVTSITQISTSFYALLDQTLKTPDLNSNSLNFLFRSYRRSQEALRDVRKRIVRQIDEDGTNAESLSSCFPLFDNARNQLRFAFLETYTEVASKKKDILLFEKYDSINTQFENLHEDMRVTSENISKFNDLLPCFITACLRQ
jgi:hypothetical protein